MKKINYAKTALCLLLALLFCPSLSACSLRVEGKTFVLKEQSFEWKEGTANDTKILVYDNYESILESYEIEEMSKVTNDEQLQRAMELIAAKKDPVLYTFTETGELKIGKTSVLYYTVDKENDQILVYADAAREVQTSSYRIDGKKLIQKNELSGMIITLVYVEKD